MKKITILLLCVLFLRAGIPFAAAGTVENIAQQILGAQQVDDVLASFSTQPPQGEADAAQASEAEGTPAPQLPEDVEPDYNFTVVPVFPDNQIGNTGAYDLLVKPGDTQTIDVNVINLGTGDITISVYTAPAYTNANGVIEYGETDAALLYETDVPAFDEVVSTEVEQIDLAWQESKTVSFQIEVPEEPFEGTLAGGLRFVREPNERDTSGGGTIGFLYLKAFSVGMQLRETEETVEPNFELVGITPNVATVFSTHLEIDIGNNTPMQLQQYSVDVEIFGIDEDGNPAEEPVASKSSQLISFAPHSIMPYQVVTGRLDEGEYMATVVLTDDEENSYELEMPFTVSEEPQAEEEDPDAEPEDPDAESTDADEPDADGPEEAPSADADSPEADAPAEADPTESASARRNPPDGTDADENANADADDTTAEDTDEMEP